MRPHPFLDLNTVIPANAGTQIATLVVGKSGETAPARLGPDFRQDDAKDKHTIYSAPQQKTGADSAAPVFCSRRDA